MRRRLEAAMGARFGAVWGLGLLARWPAPFCTLWISQKRRALRPASCLGNCGLHTTTTRLGLSIAETEQCGGRHYGAANKARKKVKKKAKKKARKKPTDVRRGDKLKLGRIKLPTVE